MKMDIAEVSDDIAENSDNAAAPKDQGIWELCNSYWASLKKPSHKYNHCQNYPQFKYFFIKIPHIPMNLFFLIVNPLFRFLFW